MSRPGIRSAILGAAVLAAATLPAGRAAAAQPTRPGVERLADHLESVVPALLDESGVPGAAVALVHEGRVAYLGGFGWADRASGVRVHPETLFNVGSISKTLTAWGVLSLVERGELRLETPIAELLGGWPLVDGSPPDGVTVVRLLSHSAGLTGASVPEYLPWEPVADPRSWLSSGDVRLASPPGESWSYSGAGYSLLQLAVEQVTGVGFAEQLRRSVLEPLGMESSTFRHPLSGVARPHESGAAIPRRRYADRAAAGLYASARDLARFLAAHTPSAAAPAGRGVVSAPTLARMRRPTPGSESPYGTAYGLGYAVWPLATGELSSGHRGQNHGWSAVAWLSPDGSDGLAVLTNDSDGEELYRRVFCDWARWLAGEPSFGAYCAARDEPAAGSLFAAEGEVGGELREWLPKSVSGGGPGVAALVARGEEVLVRGAIGLADLETGVELTPTTPFYVASVAKPLTAVVILRLIERGDLALDDAVAELLPGFPTFGRRVTVRQLLEHSSGTPDLWDVFAWRRPAPTTNQAVFDLVRESGRPAFAPGERFEYSNTGYMGLASLAQAVTGKSFAELLAELWGGAPGSSALTVLDEGDADLPQRARGYGGGEAGPRLSDYRRLELPGLRPIEPGFSIVGAGGVVSNLDGLFRFARSYLSGELLSAPLMRLVASPGRPARGIEGLGGTPRAALGLFVSDVADRSLLWQDGSLFGHRSLLMIEPEREIVIVLLANSAEIDLQRIAAEMLHRIA